MDFVLDSSQQSLSRPPPERVLRHEKRIPIPDGFGEQLRLFETLVKEILTDDGIILAKFNEMEQVVETRLGQIRQLREEQKRKRAAVKELSDALQEFLATA